MNVLPVNIVLGSISEFETAMYSLMWKCIGPILCTYGIEMLSLLTWIAHFLLLSFSFFFSSLSSLVSMLEVWEISWTFIALTCIGRTMLGILAPVGCWSAMGVLSLDPEIWVVIEEDCESFSWVFNEVSACICCDGRVCTACAGLRLHYLLTPGVWCILPRVLALRVGWTIGWTWTVNIAKWQSLI